MRILAESLPADMTMVVDPLTPRPEHRFTFGLWTVGNPGRDPFGDPTRASLDPLDTVRHLAELGAWGVSLHDDDLVPWGTSSLERDRIVWLVKRELKHNGLRVGMATTNLFKHPAFKDGAFTSNDRSVRRAALGKAMRGIDLGAELEAEVYDFWGGREGVESGAAKDPLDALERYREAIDLLAEYVVEQGYAMRFAIEPKPNEPRGDIFLPTIGHALSFISELEHSEMVGLNPQGGHEEMASLNFAPGLAQALWHGKLFHVDLNGQNGPRYDQDLRFGAGNARGAFWVVDTLEAGGYDGPVHFDYKPPRTENDEGVWDSAAACMRNYLILREKARAFRADPEVKAALAAARVAELAEPTLAPGETWRDVRDASADIDALAARGMAYEHLDQLALEHLYGVR